MVETQLFYSRLEELVKLSKKSFNQVERELSYPRNTLHNYKNSGAPSAIRLIELAHYFGVNPEYLLGVSKDCKVISLTSFFLKLEDSQKKELAILCYEWLLYIKNKDFKKEDG